MSAPNELSFDEILKFMIAHNGKVTNHELVKHFKVFLMNPDMRDEARSTFKKHVNTLAKIKTLNNEKWLILKSNYLPVNGQTSQEPGESKSPDTSTVSVHEFAPEPSHQAPPYRPPPPLQLNQDFNIIANLLPEYTPPVETPQPITQSESNESFSISEDVPPKVHPRRKSVEKNIGERRTSVPTTQTAPMSRLSIPNEDMSVDEPMSPLMTSRSESMLIDNEQKISVKERKQMFNRMASENDVLKPGKVGENHDKSVDEEDRVSLDQKSESEPLDPKQKQWILCAARGEYHTLAKMCKENPKLAWTKDPFTGTAMHWACKRGDENLVKMLAGAARPVVDERSGYTPLHIAMQFRHENVYRLLVEVYDANPNVRDWAGKTPRQYLVQKDTSMSPGSYRSYKAIDSGRPKLAPPTIRISPNTHTLPSKKESFLRIGSLNVRVKKTTEAFSNFLGVGATRSSAYNMPKRDRDSDRRSDDGDQIKSWGSADNIQKENKATMPPPMSGKVKRRAGSARKGLAVHSRSTPSTPDQPRAQMGSSEGGDSDSDTAAGFHAAWRQQRASCT